MSDQWVRFSDALQSLDVHEAVRATGFLDRCLQSVAESPDESTLLGGLLPELVTEFSAQWCGVLVRNSEWELEAEYGHFPLHTYWGPGANEESTAWILDAAREAIEGLNGQNLKGIDMSVQEMADRPPSRQRGKPRRGRRR